MASIISTLGLNAAKAREVHDAFMAARFVARGKDMQAKAAVNFPPGLDQDDKIDIIFGNEGTLAKCVEVYRAWQAEQDARNEGRKTINATLSLQKKQALQFATLIKNGAMTPEQVAVATNPIVADLARQYAAL